MSHIFQSQFNVVSPSDIKLRCLPLDLVRTNIKRLSTPYFTRFNFFLLDLTRRILHVLINAFCVVYEMVLTLLSTSVWAVPFVVTFRSPSPISFILPSPSTMGLSPSPFLGVVVISTDRFDCLAPIVVVSVCAVLISVERM